MTGHDTVRISFIADIGDQVWDDFVHAAPAGTFFHLAGWKRIIEKAFGHRTYYLVAHRDAVIAGVLPLTHMRSFLFGNALVSNAFCVHGGALVTDEGARTALVAEAVKLAHELQVEYVEFRSADIGSPDWICKDDLYVTFRKPLYPDPDANLKAISRKQRAMIRKGIANGLRSERDCGVDRLHHIYAESVRNLGTPVFAKRYFRLLKEEFGDACDIVTILHENHPVASVMNFYFRDQVLPYYGGGVLAARTLAANDFMYWEVMRLACERGFRLFDFGRSKIGTGAYWFKHHWGFEPVPLKYEFHLINSDRIPQLNPLNPKFAPLIAAWRRMPLALTKLIGPAIVRSLG